MKEVRWGRDRMWNDMMKQERKKAKSRAERDDYCSLLSCWKAESSKIPEVWLQLHLFFYLRDSSLFFPFTPHSSCHHQLFMLLVEHMCSGKDKKFTGWGGSRVRETTKTLFTVAAVGWSSLSSCAEVKHHAMVMDLLPVPHLFQGRFISVEEGNAC